MLLRRRAKLKGRKSSSSSALYQYILTQGPQHPSASLSVCHLPFHPLLCLLLQRSSVRFPLPPCCFLFSFVHLLPPQLPLLVVAFPTNFVCLLISVHPCVQSVCHLDFSICHVCMTRPEKRHNAHLIRIYLF